MVEDVQSSLKKLDVNKEAVTTPKEDQPKVEGDAQDQDERQLWEWDFTLPEITKPVGFTQGIGVGGGEFSMFALVEAMQHGAPLGAVRNYLDSYDFMTVRSHINDKIAGFPAMFYAVATNDEFIVRLFAAHGGNVEAVQTDSQVPLLAFAIMHGGTARTDTTTMVATLLGLGAPPGVIPSGFYTPYSIDLSTDTAALSNVAGFNQPSGSWCAEAARTRLARSLNLTQRYYLERTTRTKKPSRKRRQVAQLRNAEGLLGISYFLIGQTIAANWLTDRLLAHLLVPTGRPLVLCFAGPSGHGKTELAKQLGHLLSLDLEVVDCTIVTREMELFGPRDPYQGSQRGSPLNNFLAAHHGQRCIVFLDEFEKTTSSIHEALLLPFDNGIPNLHLSGYPTY
jgi:AAA domain (dynein-related subfamily)